LFEIHRSFKFATVVAKNGGPTSEIRCAFYLHDDEWLFGGGRDHHALAYSLAFVRRTGGEYLSLLELRSRHDVEVARVCFTNGRPFGVVCRESGLRFGRELHMTEDAWRFTPAGQLGQPVGDPRDPVVGRRLLELGYLVLHEGKTFRQYDDRWGDVPRYVVAAAQLADKSQLLTTARYYRLAHRNIAGPGDENVSIWAIHKPGCVHGHSTSTELEVTRPTSVALVVLSVTNSFSFDYLLSLRVRANVLAFMRDAQPYPQLASRTSLGHWALRMVAGDSGFEPLWREQLGEVWREPKSPFTWPVLEGDDARWAVRAAIDAVVAWAYGLSRQQYAHVLSTFSHRSYPRAPELCLGRFDELKSIGLEAFTRRHDPYWDIPLNESLPQPVIDLPIPGEALSATADGTLDFEGQGGVVYEPTPASADLLIAAERQPPYRTRKAKGKKGR
jgi:hypothetical protein